MKLVRKSDIGTCSVFYDLTSCGFDDLSIVGTSSDNKEFHNYLKNNSLSMNTLPPGDTVNERIIKHLGIGKYSNNPIVFIKKIGELLKIPIEIDSDLEFRFSQVNNTDKNVSLVSEVNVEEILMDVDVEGVNKNFYKTNTNDIVIDVELGEDDKAIIKRLKDKEIEEKKLKELEYDEKEKQWELKQKEQDLREEQLKVKESLMATAQSEIERVKNNKISVEQNILEEKRLQGEKELEKENLKEISETGHPDILDLTNMGESVNSSIYELDNMTNNHNKPDEKNYSDVTSESDLFNTSVENLENCQKENTKIDLVNQIENLLVKVENVMDTIIDHPVKQNSVETTSVVINDEVRLIYNEKDMDVKIKIYYNLLSKLQGNVVASALQKVIIRALKENNEGVTELLEMFFEEV